MYKVLAGQNLSDISIQESGTIENLFEIAKKNGLSITEPLQSGTEIDVLQDLKKDVKTVNYYTNRGLKPASGSSKIMEEGIEFWGIEFDFVVS